MDQIFVCSYSLDQGYDSKQSDGGAPVIIIAIVPSPVRVPSMGPIELVAHLLYFRPVSRGGKIIPPPATNECPDMTLN